MTWVQPATSSPAPAASGVPDRARGLARYTADLISPGTVLVGLARSPYAHARVSSIDIQATLKIPGVLAVLTPTDFDASSTRKRVGSRVARSRYA